MEACMMIRRKFGRHVALLIVGCLLVQTGCSKTGNEVNSESNEQAYEASGGLPTAPVADQTTGTGADQASGQGQAGDPTPLTLAPVNEPPEAQPRLELRPNLSPQQLEASLAEIDTAIKTIRNGQSGISDQREARAELLRVIPEAFRIAASMAGFATPSFSASWAQADNGFSRVYVFGDSLSDTGNAASLVGDFLRHFL